MQIHEIKRNHKQKSHKTVGRGGTRGKTSGRGTKGQNARAGRKKRPELRDIIKKLPKLRGYREPSIAIKPVVITLDRLAKLPAGSAVTPISLVEAGIIKTVKGRVPAVKLLGGTLEVKLSVSKCLVTAGAKATIEKAGGSVAAIAVTE